MAGFGPQMGPAGLRKARVPAASAASGYVAARADPERHAEPFNRRPLSPVLGPRAERLPRSGDSGQKTAPVGVGNAVRPVPVLLRGPDGRRSDRPPRYSSLISSWNARIFATVSLTSSHISEMAACALGESAPAWASLTPMRYACCAVLRSRRSRSASSLLA